MEESSGDDQSYIPQVGDDRKPNIGRRFESLDDAYSYYNQYARESGFSARISNSKRSKKTSEVVWKKIVCFKEGKTDEVRWSKEANSDKPRQNRDRRDIRSGCKAKISVVNEQHGTGWMISTFVENHNHPLATPSKVHLLRSHRSVFVSKKALSQQFAEANIPTFQQMRIFEIDHGGPENVGCTERDLRNYQRSLREEHMGMDAETFVDFLQSEKEKCVNHHGQTILFGCGFLSDERTESFVWLLDKLSYVIFRDHYQSIRNVIVHSTTSDEFEESWKMVMESAGLVQDDWLILMYDLRHRWVPTYFLNVFSAGISSSQRSESSHAFFKRYISNKNALMDFIVRFNKALRNQRHNELVADHIDMNERPKVMSNWPMETQMVKVYTKTKWLEFQKEVGESHHYYVEQAYASIFSCQPDDPERCLMSRHWNLSFRSSALVDAASMTEEGTKFLHEQFDHIDCKMKELNICIPSRNASENRRSMDKAIAIIDPCVIRTKGCGKRLKSSKEKATSKGRQCHGCGRRGVSHDKRNCPNLLDKSSANNDNEDDGSDEEDF
ncbi:protein FAR1-RELATED SEQUENCE 5-like [Henckelia pumila]|uniref:protein FAR1-RELATED SEQUENCE 5-like n=1 Tax=Henckelia pumila TaxID=405737 RepID=UPI003C6DE476